ncbi:MAG TPA: ABC transporter ATP-binding protein [Acholeplasmataceae bacterium]|nr:ABC transporter ATP-binding protein [Acholeplasmataceae bacterium]
MKLIITYLLKYKRYFFINLLAVFGVAAAELGIPIIISNIIDKALPTSDLNLLYKLGGFLAAVAIFGSIGNIIINYASARTSTLILRDLRGEVFKKIQTFSPEEINDYGISSLMTRTTSDVFQILNFVSVFYRVAFMAPVMILVATFLVATRTPSLLSNLLIVIPIIILGIILVVILSRSLSERQQRNLDRINLVTRENLTGVRVVRAFRKNKYEKERFQVANETYSDNAIKLFRLMTSIEPIFFFILNVALVITIYYASGRINLPNSDLTIGQLVEYNDFQFLVMFSILTFAQLFIMYPRTMVSARRINDILDREPKVKNNENALTHVKDLGTLDFKNVSFSYPDSEASVLHNISFSAKKGETIAFIGSTGSGKSTLINLVPRLYNVTQGEILFNNVNINDYDLKYLRSKVGFISQKAILFKGTIEMNIKFGKHDATLDEVIAAAKIAQAHDFILEKENGYQDMVSELGSNLSGGQKQRLSIARALIKKPDIYIFDDSFSALDYKTDAMLRSVLKNYAKDAITLIVAQRVSSIIDSDKIIVLDYGNIVCEGTHDDLMASCTIYQEIAKSQLSEEELSK